MNMIARNRSLQNFHFLGKTDFPNQIPKTNGNFARQNTFAVLRDPNKVKLDVETTM